MAYRRRFANAVESIATIAILGTLSGAAHAANMIGYWEGWNSLTLGSVSSNYDVIDLAFALPGGTDNATISFSQSVESASQLASDVSSLKSRGKRVIVSIGGGTSPNLELLNSTDINNFVNSVESIVNQYGLNGIDLDLENSTLDLQSGDNNYTSPTTPTIKNLITAVQDLQSHYGSSFLVTYAPETVDVNAYGSYGGENGSYLPVIYALRSTNQIVATQCYDSGSQYGLNGGIYNEGTDDFDVSQAELLLHGYHMANGQSFPALSQGEVAFGVPATSNAADSASYMSPSNVLAAAEYLGSGTSDGGSYHLAGGPYPNFGGVMTWDINYDEGQGYALADTLVSYLHSIGGSGGGGGLSAGNHTLAPECATGSRLDDTGGSTTNGNPLQIWQAAGNANQTWAFSQTGVSPSGDWNASVLGPYCLNAYSPTSGSPATIWACNGVGNEAWNIVADSSPSGYYQLHPSSNTSLCLDVSGAGSANGTAVQVYTCNSTNAQQWVID